METKENNKKEISKEEKEKAKKELTKRLQNNDKEVKK